MSVDHLKFLINSKSLKRKSDRRDLGNKPNPNLCFADKETEPEMLRRLPVGPRYWQIVERILTLVLTLFTATLLG